MNKDPFKGAEKYKDKDGDLNVTVVTYTAKCDRCQENFEATVRLTDFQVRSMRDNRAHVSEGPHTCPNCL